jgi:hypothetical protein
MTMPMIGAAGNRGLDLFWRELDSGGTAGLAIHSRSYSGKKIRIPINRVGETSAA